MQYDVIVIGGGKGGKTLAVELGHQGVKTALIERDPEMIGGSCINRACIPTKTFVASAHAAHAARHAGTYGVRTGDVSVDWGAVRARVEGVTGAMREMNHKNFTSAPATDFIIGEARFTGPRTVEVNGQTLTADKVFINTGTRPARARFPGGELVLDSNAIQRLDALPSHLVVVGAGYIALEFAQMFRRFGSQVTVLVRGKQILSNEDADVANELAQALEAEGVAIRYGVTIEDVRQGPEGLVIAGVTASHVLVAVGREPVTESLNLAAAGVELDQRGYIKVNERLETTAEGVWALGDINGGPQFTHVSLDDYRIVKANVFGPGGRTTKDRLVPAVLFTDPELARVGLTEREASKQGRDYRVLRLAMGAIPRARTLGATRGQVKLLVENGSEKIIGASLLGPEAGEMLGAVQMAMIAGLPFARLRDAVLAHPTLVEGFGLLR